MAFGCYTVSQGLNETEGIDHRIQCCPTYLLISLGDKQEESLKRYYLCLQRAGLSRRTNQSLSLKPSYSGTLSLWFLEYHPWTVIFIFCANPKKTRGKTFSYLRILFNFPSKIMLDKVFPRCWWCNSLLSIENFTLEVLTGLPEAINTRSRYVMTNSPSRP